MTINIRQKGAEGEREIVKILTAITVDVMRSLNSPEEEVEKALKMIQRNQNQSAVGGNDLSNTFGLSIEVKRQEALSPGTWWAQCVAAAERNKELPVLMYRQNRKPWRIRTFAWLTVPTDSGGWGYQQSIVEFGMDEFKAWFTAWVRGRILQGYELKS
jgi:hypothetical protein